MTVDDEHQFWASCADQAKKKNEQVRNKAFVEALTPLVRLLRLSIFIETNITYFNSVCKSWNTIMSSKKITFNK